MLSEEYSVKCGLMLSRIPDKMYVFEITKKCGYSEFVLVYKDSPISDLFTIASNRFSTNVNCLYLMFFVFFCRYRACPIPTKKKQKNKKKKTKKQKNKKKLCA